MNRAAFLLLLAFLAACEQQPAAPPPPASGTTQTPVGVAIDRPAATKKDELTPGQWELNQITRSVSGKNVTEEMRNQMLGKSVAYDACIPADEARLPDANFFAGGSTAECKYTQHDWKNGKLSATIACNATPGAITMKMTGAYDATTMLAEATMSTTGAGSGNIEQAVQLRARRLGECKPSQKTPR